MKSKRIYQVLLVFVMTVALFPVTAFAASIGQSLPSPEAGWQRYDDSHEALKLIGEDITKQVAPTDNDFYNKVVTFTNNPTGNDKITFKFKGTKIRIITYSIGIYSSSVNITIDGNTETYSNYRVPQVLKMLAYEKVGLPDTVHTVEIYTGVPNQRFNIDAIDIDVNGALIHPDAVPESPLNLNAVGGTGNVSLAWNEAIYSDYYTVSRAESSGGPYNTVSAAVYGTSFTDMDVVNGTTYYYIVNAVNTNGISSPSNEASATPMSPIAPVRAILTIWLTNGMEKEYDLSKDEVNAFISWFDAKDAGIGSAKYAFEKTWNTGPYNTRTEYVIFDKIVTFNVDEYDFP